MIRLIELQFFCDNKLPLPSIAIILSSKIISNLGHISPIVTIIIRDVQKVSSYRRNFSKLRVSLVSTLAVNTVRSVIAGVHI